MKTQNEKIRCRREKGGYVYLIPKLANDSKFMRQNKLEIDEVVKFNKPEQAPVVTSNESNDEIQSVSQTLNSPEAIERIKSFDNKEDLLTFVGNDQRKGVLKALEEKLNTL